MLKTLLKTKLKAILRAAMAAWTGSQYDTLQRNCNHFSDYIAFKLCGKRIPSRVNALANTTNAAVGMLGGLLSGMTSALEAAASGAQRDYDSIPVAHEVDESGVRRANGPEIRVIS